MNDTMKQYYVEHAASGVRKAVTAPTTLTNATAALRIIAAQMQESGWLRTDSKLIRKLSVTILAKDLKTVALRVVEDGNATLEDTKESVWAVGTYPIATNSEATSDYVVDVDQTPADGLYTVDELADGYDVNADIAEAS